MDNSNFEIPKQIKKKKLENIILIFSNLRFIFYFELDFFEFFIVL